ncbi:hypothetical protein NDU88_002209 [Pleurodeles waltl]|uniref:Uncharacterized protein n=1 Tax=Pleurodeles waltl TaxID=8319 RepID=A0AAV7NES6_PLEWA|nr:hypothetical protein NDU88_002209 [Pleurodeles waltl]
MQRSVGDTVSYFEESTELRDQMAKELIKRRGPQLLYVQEETCLSPKSANGGPELMARNVSLFKQYRLLLPEIPVEAEIESLVGSDRLQIVPFLPAENEVSLKEGPGPIQSGVGLDASFLAQNIDGEATSEDILIPSPGNTDPPRKGGDDTSYALVFRLPPGSETL